MSQRTPGSMGPPSRPIDKPSDSAELNDVIAQSGVNLRDEESLLTASFGSRPGHESNAGTAHDVTPMTTTLRTPGSASGPPPRFALDELQQHAEPDLGHPSGSGSLSKRSVHYHEPLGDREERSRRQDLYEQRRREADHLLKPFLTVGGLLKILFSGGELRSKEGSPEILNRQPHGMPQARVKLGQPSLEGIRKILTLASMATQERMRGLLEESAALSIHRRSGSGGVVPTEWTSLAVPTSNHPEARGTFKTVGSHTENPLKRPFSASNPPTPDSDKMQSTTKNKVFPNVLVNHLRSAVSKDREIEEARFAKRAKRANQVPGSATSENASPATPGTPGSAITTGLLGERAPEVPQKKLTKKEQAKLANVRLDEAQQHRASNNTASFMLGGGASRFGKKGKYDWMNAGGGGSGNTTPGKIGPGGIGSNIPTPRPVGTSSPAPVHRTVTSNRRLGEWREIDEGMGIQVRDWTRVLETDGHDKRILVRSLTKLG
ncbi:MAG: signal recognition particle subunit [Watsoniomyces obsoletus]|nr:MAG: signal recognition particle subunit [Watsoniomyces obsoletus]